MSSPLVSTAELTELLGDVTLLDVRYRIDGPDGREQFLAGHLPGATYVDLGDDLAAPPGAGGRHPLPLPSDFEAAMRRVGVSTDRPVVVYDDWSARAAGRAWWLLRFHGHPDVRVLDGGWKQWQRDGGAVEMGESPVEVGDFTSRPGAMPVVAAGDVLDVEVLIDARAEERYRGEVEPIDSVAGHIPGAVNVPTSCNLTAQGTFLPAEELRAVYAALGVSEDHTVAAYCGSGVTATHDIIAMEIAGFRAALYPGSWSGWIADPGRPVTSESP